MDEFNYLQFLNDDYDLLAAGELLADDFPTFAVSFNQVIADFFPNIAAVPHGLEFNGTKTKTTATTTTTTQQDEAADVSRFPVVSNKDIEELKSVAANKKDLVSYRGPRSMVTVDMSVDTRSTHGRYLGRCIHRVSFDCRSSIGRVSVEHRPLYRRRIDRSFDHLRSRDRPTVGRDGIGRVSAIYR